MEVEAYMNAKKTHAKKRTWTFEQSFFTHSRTKKNLTFAEAQKLLKLFYQNANKNDCGLEQFDSDGDLMSFASGGAFLEIKFTPKK